jgi:hypothetical protein
MKPVNFQYANTVLQPAENMVYSENVAGISPLYIYTDGEQCVSYWKLTIKERLQVLFHGHIWCSVLSGYTQPPITLDADKEYFMEIKP